MSQSLQLKSPAKPSQHGQLSSFASALHETLPSSADGGPVPSGLDAFREALMKAKGGDSKMGTGSENLPNGDIMEQQKKLLEQAKLRREQHARVNPVETQALFDAREKQEKQKIEQIRANLKSSSYQLQAQDQQVYNTLNTEIVEVGERGSYFSNFYHWLQEQVALWMKNAKSGNDWLAVGKKKKGLQAGAKNSKAGTSVAKTSVTTTKNVQGSFHYEKSMNGGAG